MADEVGLNKIFLFPEKMDKIKRFIRSRIVDYSYPISVELSLTDKCNQDCVWCSDKELRKRNKYSSLEKKVVFELLDDLSLHKTKGITIEGGGEPTLHPDFNEIVKYAKSKKLALGLITNGTNDLEDKVIKEFEWIRTSLDASNRKEYKKFKRRDYFDTVMKNIKHFASKTYTGVGYLVAKGNLDDIGITIKNLKKANVRYIQFRPVIDYPDIASNVELLGLKKFETNDFSVNLSSMNYNKERGNKGLPCYSHSLTNVIDGAGNVWMCGRLNIYPWWKPIGNIKEKSFYDIWHSKERREQIKQLLDSNFCFRYCPECRMTKFNSLLNEVTKYKSKDFM
jgi:MoaA/NifB/PqqE/SkfB family radical SAM enzyme